MLRAKYFQGRELYYSFSTCGVTKTDLAEYEQFLETRPIKGKHLKACVPMDLDPIHHKADAADYTNDAKKWLGVLPDFVTELVRRSQIGSIDLTWVSEGSKARKFAGDSSAWAACVGDVHLGIADLAVAVWRSCGSPRSG